MSRDSWYTSVRSDLHGRHEIPLLLFRIRREVFEHLLYSFAEVIDVLVRIVRNCVAGRASPDQILGLGVEQIDNQSTDFVGFSCCSRVSEYYPPTPASAKAIVKRVFSLFILGASHIA